MHARAPPAQRLLRGGYKRDLRAFQGEKGIIDALVHLRKKRGAGGRVDETVGESVLATPLWGTIYADDAGVVAQSPDDQLRKMMGVIVVVRGVWPHRIGG